MNDGERGAIVVIPTYNEKENVENLIPAIFSLVPEIHVLVVDDNSPDGTAEAIQKLKKTYSGLRLLSRRRKEGLGKAYVQGFEEALKDPQISTLIMMDADLSHDPKHLKEMLALRSEYDLVIGSRYIPGGATIGWELWRRLLSRFANLYARTIIGAPFKDCTTGYNAISAKILSTVNFDTINLSGYAFIIHLKYLLYKAGARVREIPIVFKNRTAGTSKMSLNIISEGVLAPWKML
ncbi:MAG: hypothetical protein A2849_01110 [Candidatus Taylorbacteria bacterium RIFCSPHIGHO2_01_FULL_51_15]|uniref:Glycosyltransferase 2-like domain-containing protein n=1 Tax=Candidatus Taylorbacteria bacterium RIFCSPHIGHO2_01_FULL_51_15 TaxID=1802304 RepID=A0A1G2M931_9BACT|nr:MAG: hypothetical protein A2849_01110 [Candidatus Taylorbacteria bacterium RIFCSPHIGHO2_01_FULL_51_15]